MGTHGFRRPGVQGRDFKRGLVPPQPLGPRASKALTGRWCKPHLSILGAGMELVLSEEQAGSREEQFPRTKTAGATTLNT